jgi:PTH2 family peptidyl-tRNA hydrolase
MKTKQVIVVRKDLNMRKGKMCAQAAHASLGAVFSRSFTDQDLGGNDYKVIPMEEELKSWFEERFTKICVGCDSEEQLLELASKAKEAGLLHFLCRDAGLTEFDGVPTYTTLAIGPCEDYEVDEITGRLSLL